MPMSCSAFGCKNRFKTGGKLQFFGFPLKNEDLLNSWIKNVRRKDFAPTKYSKICSELFKENYYLLRPATYIRKLKPDTIPTIFPAFPSYLKGNESSRRVLKKSTLGHFNIVQSNVVQHLTMNHGDIAFQHQMSVPLQLDKEIQTEENAVEQRLKQKIKSLQQKIRRRNKKVTNFKEMIKTLRKKGLLQQEAENLLTQQFQSTALEIFKN